MIKRISSHFGIFFAFSFVIFNVLWFTIGLVGVIIYILEKVGFLRRMINENVYISIIGLLLILSTIIGVVLTMIGVKLMLKPVQNMLQSMKKLAEGDFNTRIQLSGIFCPKELVEFSEQFNTTAKELSSIEMLRSDFINNFSHEFKTPIVSLKGFAKLLKSSTLSEEEKNEYLDIIISESDRLAALSTNVLNLTKIENQTIITEKRTFNLSEQVRRMILMLEPKWSEKSLNLDVDIEEDVLYFGNAELLSQVWVNIMDNAIKFSPRSSNLVIKLSYFYDSTLFKVQDVGCGMDEETRQHMFDKFYHGDKSHTTTGNGLGMAVVKKIVTLHKGEITVDSKAGIGTTLTVSLPKMT